MFNIHYSVFEKGLQVVSNMHSLMSSAYLHCPLRTHVVRKRHSGAFLLFLSTVHICFSHMCFPVKKNSGRSSLALAVWNSSLSLNLHSSSSSSLPTVCLKELRSALMTHRVAPTGRQTGGRGTETLTMT